MSLVKILGLAVQISIFLTVFSFGLRSTTDDLLYLFRRPVLLVRSLTSIFIVMPVFVGLFISTFELNPVVEIALITLSVSPVPPLLPHKVLKAEEGKPFTFGLFAAAAILCITVIPVAVRIINLLFDRYAHFSERSILRTIIIGVIVPIFAGMIIRRYAPVAAERYGSTIEKIGSILLIAGFLPILIALLPVMWSLIGNGTIMAIIAFSAIGIVAGHILGGPEPRDRAALAVASSSRHPAIAITLAVANIGETETKLVAAAVVLYALVSAAVAAGYLHWLTKGSGHFEGSDA